jgi:glycine reductase
MNGGPRRQILDVGAFDVSDVRAGAETAFADGILTIDIEELEGLLSADPDLAAVSVEIVRPGESVRVINAIDAVEPRIKVDPPGADFSGLLTVPKLVGTGTTHALKGVAVVETALPVPGEPRYWREAVFDMGGPTATYSPLSELINVVVSCEPTTALLESEDRPTNVFEGTPEAVEYNKAVRLAGLKAARYLAETTLGQEPDRVDTYDLAPSPVNGLPAVVYLYQLAIPFLHGEIAPGAGAIGGAAHLPTPIHPNELLDGALVCGWNAIACMRELTYTVQNHAIIEDLYARHGEDIDFRGVVLFTNGDTRAAKERLANHAANLAIMMGAEGAVINYAGGGHPAVDAMMICRNLERRGVTTTMLSMEMAANPGESGFVHFVQEADAIVSTGNYEETVLFEPVERVIGGDELIRIESDPSGAFEAPLAIVMASTHQFGGTRIRGEEY